MTSPHLVSHTFRLTVLLAFATPAWAQGSRDPAAELATLEHQWVQALVARDTSRLGRVLADTYIDTDEEGHRSTKADVLGALQSGDLVLQDISLSNMQVHLYGSAAVVTGQAAQRGAYRGQAVAPMIVFTDTFVMIHARWTAVASQRTALAVNRQ